MFDYISTLHVFVRSLFERRFKDNLFIVENVEHSEIMAFGLTIGTERALALQQSIQNELLARGYTSESDPVMADKLQIRMELVNLALLGQITAELEDLVGTDFGVLLEFPRLTPLSDFHPDTSFTDWLFSEASKGAAVEEQAQQEPSTSTSDSAPRDAPPPVHADSSRRQPPSQRSNVYQQAISQALPSSVPSGHKRSASARSPSPNHPNKSRRTDLPTGPRAMTRHEGGATNSRSLIDRIGGQNAARSGSGPNGFPHDEIQSRIDNIVNTSPEQNMMMTGGFPGMGGASGMDMSAMAGMANPMVFQDILMNQMALMAQMTNMMNSGQYVAPGGFPMQGIPADMNMYPGGINGFQGQMNGNDAGGRGRGRGASRGGRGGANRGRGGSMSANATTSSPGKPSDTTPTKEISQTAPIVAPLPITPTPSTTTTAPQRLGYVLPERPQSPTLCKFSTKCTNAQCRYAHPSPVATTESGVVLSNEACEKGKDCQDKDCIKGHVSPAVLNPQPLENIAPAPIPQTHVHNSPVPCRFGAACTRPNCSFSHPPRTPISTQCRFGAACTRAGCTFAHPDGRVLPTSFHRGLSTSAPLVTVSTPETGTMSGSASHNKSVTFNKTPGPGQGVKEKLAQQMKEIEQRKLEAEKAVRDAEAAAGKKDGANPVAIAA
ncbi:hypothetical protein H0H93_007357 [Arthromyces matolae]|nr:hypothetical protein H0H93_007357 [Arthromyces matolae]